MTQTRKAELDAKFSVMSRRQRLQYFYIMHEQFEALCKKRERDGFLSAEERARGQEFYDEEQWSSRTPGSDEEPTSPLLDWWDHLVMTEAHFGKTPVMNRTPYFTD